jgi:uncharacterized protein (TIGR02453 family)
MKPTFTGFPPEAMAFFRSLKRNNRREWFQPRKQVYDEQVKAPMTVLVGFVNTALLKFAPDYVRDPSESIYRIYRDTRFSKDKTPYKTQIAALFWRRGVLRHQGPAFYFSVSPDEIEVAGGVYMPDQEHLRAFRNHLAGHHEEFRAIVRKKNLRALLGELQGERLTRVPKGFCADHPAADLVCAKQWLFDTMLDPALAAGPGLVGEVVTRFRAMAPFIEFLNRALEEKRTATRARELF